MHLTPYSGAAYQRGHGIGAVFRSLFRVGIPLLKSKLGRRVIKTGVGLAGDAIRGRNMKEAVKRRVKDAVLSTVIDGLSGGKSSPSPKRRKKASAGKNTARGKAPSAAARASQARRRARKGTRTPSRGRDIFD